MSDNLRSDDIRRIIGSLSDDSDPDSPDATLPTLLSDENDSDHASDVEEMEFDVSDDSDSDVDDPGPSSGQWREWAPHDVGFTKFPFQLAGQCGFRPPPNFDRDSDVDFFSLFFTDELFNEIVVETNRYAREKIHINTPLTQNSCWHSWTDITLPELKAFIGVILNMSLNTKPNMEDFFSSNWLDYQPFFKDVFSKERFFQIFWSLHISPPSNTGHILGTLTRSGKVRKFLQYLETRFQEYYTPSENISVDESTIGFRGRVSFRVYNKDKPTKWGIKVFVLCDASNGYVSAVEPYMGANTYSTVTDRPDLLVTTKVVLSLVNKLENTVGNVEGYHIFTDRYYTSIELARELYKKNIHLTGTINRGRVGLPKEIKSKPKLKKADIISFRKDASTTDPVNVHIIEWKDKRSVLMLTTLYDNSTQNISRKVRGGAEEVVVKPTVICRYNDNMGGVDIADHYISSYSFTRRTVKWWRKVFFWALDVCVVNSFLLKNMSRAPGMKPFRQRDYRKKLIVSLVGEVRNLRKRGRPSMLQTDERLNGKLHIPELLGPRKNKDCVVCTQRGQGERKRSRLFCDTCENKPGLHPGNCFRLYHTAKKYK